MKAFCFRENLSTQLTRKTYDISSKIKRFFFNLDNMIPEKINVYIYSDLFTAD